MMLLLDAVAGKGPTLESLRWQIAAASVASREFSGAGFFTTLTVPDEIPAAPDVASTQLGAAYVLEAPDRLDFMTVLFVRDGCIDTLEAVTFGDDPWPADRALQALHHGRWRRADELKRAAPRNFIRPVTSADLDWVREELTRHWSRPQIWSISRMFHADQLPGFIAEDPTTRERLGLVTYSLAEHVKPHGCEVVTLSSRAEGRGVGGALLDAAVQAARAAGRTRVFLTTTNDNLRALGFYQRRGWRLAALHAGIIDQARKRYPEIPVIGLNRIPLHDELELELQLEPGP